MSILDVTTGQVFATISAAIIGSGSGDVIDVSAGSYVEDFPTIGHDLTLQGVGGLAALTTPGNPLNGQGILVTNANVTLRSLDLSGAAVGDGNGAGVRVDGGNLTLVGSHIYNNQDGILANAGPGSVVIQSSEIDHNGAGDGYTHNIYVNEIARLSISDSYIHDAVAGHEVKSRADVTTIVDSRIQDQDGDSSYSVDLPDGGQATLTGTVFQKGADTQNWTYVHFGGEFYPNAAGGSLVISGNSFIDDMAAGATPHALVNATNSAADGSGSESPASVTGNRFYGFEDGTGIVDLFAPASTQTANLLLPLSSAPALDTSSPFGVAEPGSAMVLAAALLAGQLVRRMSSRPRGC